MSFTFARLSRAPAPCIRPLSLRQLSTSRTLRQLTIPTTPTCPSPTCSCASTPPDLDIDRKTPLLNTMAAYSEHVLLCTGKDDWHSNIEHEDGATGAFVKGLKGVIGKGSAGFDVCEPFYNVVISASSFAASATKDSSTALLFPAFKMVQVPHTPQAFDDFATAYLKARTLHLMHEGLSPEQKTQLLRDESRAANLAPPEHITKPVVLICGHGGRDQRCGILGPILQRAFEAEFARRGVAAEVAQISHVGGHKYAGNVIIYLPPGLRDNALKGTGIWYGRVGPENVEGVVEETVVRGRVVVELLRGGITVEGGNVGRMVEAQLARERGEDGHGGLRLKARARG